MSDKRKCWLIINPVSGGKRNSKKIIKIFKDTFAGLPEISCNIYFTEYSGHAGEIARKAVFNRVDQVIAVGGDGTMNETATGLVNSGTALSLIPTGSGNGFARSLGISLNPAEAFRSMINPKELLIDAGKVNDHYFFGIAGIGFDALISAKFQKFGVRGPLPYFYIGIREYFKYPYEPVEIQFNDQFIHTLPLLITVANTPQYGNGAIIAPGADFCDGLFELCILKKFPFIKGVVQLPRLFSGNIDRFSFFEHFKTSHVIIRMNEGGFFHTDGEPHQGGRFLEFSLIPKALKVWI